jgi:uncharacterized membrane protein (UPF0127 family)
VTDLRVVHEPPEGSDRVLATEVEFADSMLARARGLMFRSSIPDEFALVMDVGRGMFGRPARQAVHMLFVRFPIDVVWLIDDEVQQVSRMRPWRSIASARAERILELPAGNAAQVDTGDTVRVELATDLN